MVREEKEMVKQVRHRGEGERVAERLRGLLILSPRQEEHGHSGKLATAAMPLLLWRREEEDLCVLLACVVGSFLFLPFLFNKTSSF